MHFVRHLYDRHLWNVLSTVSIDGVHLNIRHACLVVSRVFHRVNGLRQKWKQSTNLQGVAVSAAAVVAVVDDGEMNDCSVLEHDGVHADIDDDTSEDAVAAYETGHGDDDCDADKKNDYSEVAAPHAEVNSWCAVCCCLPQVAIQSVP